MMIHVIICSGPCHGLWWFVVVPLGIHCDTDQNMLFSQNMGLLPLIPIVSKS